MTRAGRHRFETLSRCATIAAIIAAAAVFLALLGLNLVNRRFYVGSAGDILYYFALPATLAAASLAALALPRAWRVAVALCFVAVVPGLYGAELYLTLAARARLAAPATDGAPPDGRSKLEVIADLRRAGTVAYPTVRAKDLLVDGENDRLVSPIAAQAQPLLPLASVPEHTVVACNETGRWLTYRSDRHGFHNPPEAWAGRPAVALVGDSFVHGDCVPSDSNLGALLRRRYDRVLNLGVAGAGPLSELASIKEYLPELAPPTVVWFFFEGNDITKDLPVERRSEILMSYLKADARQDLARRRDEVSRTLAAYLDRHMEDAIGAIDHPFEAIVDYLQLDHLRETFGLDDIALGLLGNAAEDEIELFRAVLGEARRTVGAWSGRLVFVYLPDSTRYFASPRHGRIRDHVRDRILAAVRDVGLPVVDIHAAFAAHPDPTSLFYFPWSHFNEEGYRVVAAAVERAIGPPSPEPSASVVRP